MRRHRLLWLAVAVLAAVNFAAVGASRRAMAATSPPTYPIVFVPGTAASFLMEANTEWVYWFSVGQLLSNQVLLENRLNPISDLWKLALKPDGTDNPAYPIQVGDVFRTLNFGGNWGGALPWGTGDVYETFLHDLHSHGYTEGGGPNNWLYVAPYDWRKSPDFNAQTYVLPAVAQALSDHPGTKVVLIAHSQGGLVARSFIANAYTDQNGNSFRGADKVAALIAIATPWLGTPRVTQAATIGWDFGISGINAQWGPALAPNWPAVYAMMPSNDGYFANYPDGYYYQGSGNQGGRYGEPALPQDQQNSILSEQNVQAGGHLMADMMDWRARVLNGDSYGVPNYLIAGYIKPGTDGHQIQLSDLGEDPTDTIIRVVRYSPQGYHCLFWACWTYQDQEQDYVDVGAGDNTIPLASALAWSPSNGPLPSFPGPKTITAAKSVSQSVIGPYSYSIVTDLDGNGQSAVDNAKHMHLPNNELVRSTIFDILQNLITVTSGPLPSGTLGQAYSTQLLAIGGTGPYTWSSSQDLSVYGLTLDPSGLLHGTINASPISVPVTVTDSSGKGVSATLDLPVQFPAMSMDPMPPADAGQYYDQIVQARGGVAPIVTQQTGLPGWLSVHCYQIGTCEFKGTPPGPALFPFTLQLTDQGPGTQVWQNEILTVNAPPVITAQTTSVGVAPGQLLQKQFQGRRGSAPYTWGVVDSPNWMSISSGGLLSGMPPACGRWTPTVILQDAAGTQVATSLTVTVAGGPLGIVDAAIGDATVGQPYVGYNLSAVGGCAPYTWSISSGSLPPGLQLDPGTGEIRGTVTAAGSFTFTAALQDASNPPQPATQQFTIDAAQPFALVTGSLPAGTAGQAYSATLQASGGYPPYAWSVGRMCVAACPHGPGQGRGGANQGAFGSAAGIPDSAAGTLAVASVGPPQLTVAAAVFAPSPAGDTAASGLLALGPVYSDALPAGLTLDRQSGAIGGTPQQPGTYQLDVIVTDSQGQVAARRLTLEVAGGAAPPTISGLSTTSGPAAGGNTVTVLGTDLTGATAVSFGSSVGTDLQIQGDTQLTVTAPPGSGSVGLAVTTPAGTSGPVPYTYQPSPSAPVAPPSQPAASGTTGVPTVIAVSPASGSDGGGQTVTLTGTGLRGATSVEFGDFGQGQNIQVASDGSSLTVVTPEAWWGDGPVPVYVIAPAGSSDGSASYAYVSGAAAPPSTQGPAPGTTGGPTVTAVSPASGSDGGGQTVTITGTGLGGATSVEFGDFGQGQNIQVSADGTSLTVGTPQAWWGDGPVYVTVATPAGSSSGSALYTYVPGTAPQPGPGSTPSPQTHDTTGGPVVTAISPASGPDGGSQSVTLTGSGLTGATAVQFGDFGQGQNIQVSSDGTSLTVDTPEDWWGDGPTYVTVTTPGGSSNGDIQYTYGPAAP